jgi:hypothetical protein
MGLREGRIDMLKRTKQVVSAGIALIFLQICVVSAASACMAYRGFVAKDLDTAEIVFRGRIEAYQVLGKERSAKLTFAVQETFKGPNNISSWEGVWINSTYGLPKNYLEFTQLHGHEFIVGLFNSYSSWPTEYPQITEREALFRKHYILQWPCSPPFLFGVKGSGVTLVIVAGKNDERGMVEKALRERGIIE